MHGEQSQTDPTTTRREDAIRGNGGPTVPRRLSRRQAMGHLSAVAAAGAAAWAVPEVLTAKPAGGATLSSPVGPVVSTAGSAPALAAGGPDGATTVHTTPAAHGVSALAFTGLNMQRDAEVGAALVAGGWVMQHWVSRVAKPLGTGRSDPNQGDGAGTD